MMTNKDLFSFQTHKRILLKVSGEFLRQDHPDVLCWSTINALAQSIQEQACCQWVIVVGGGNIWRGRQAPLTFCNRSADVMGMMATHINGVALQEIFAHHNVPSCILTSRFIEGLGIPFSARNADAALEQGQVVICSGGTGVGGITTDTTAVLRAYETNCSLIMKGTKVDGIYDCDPQKNPDARFLPHISYTQAIDQKIAVMDTAALALAQEHKKTIIIFSLQNPIKKIFDNTAPFSILHP